MKQLTNSASSLYSLADYIDDPYESLSIDLLQHFLRALDYSAIVSITDRDGVITYVNEQFVRISGYERSELIGQKHNVVRHPDMSQRVFEQLWQTISNRKPWRGLIKNLRKDGSAYYVKSVILPVLDDNGEITQFLSIRNDVTDIIEVRHQLREQLTDDLTGLPNRMALLNELKECKVGAAAVFDLRNFKLFNDYWGIDIGDVYIRKLGEQFKLLEQSYEVKVYRLNGACFAIRPRQRLQKHEFCLMVEQVKYELEHKDILFNDIDCDIQLTVGIGISPSRALAYAESAVADSKAKFYGRAVVIKDGSDSGDNAFCWVEEIKEALRDGRLLACFQKMCSAKDPGTGNDKYEALARIKLRNGRVVSPLEFLEHLKKTRYYAELTKEMVVRALEFAGHNRCKVSVNLCIQDILDTDTVAFIEQQLLHYGGQRIIFEITESEAVNDFARVSEFIDRVRTFGATIAIDDFGSGYSNFVYLVQLKPEYIKIDGSIISGIVDNEQSYLVTKSIVDMARNLNIKTIAEFVSSHAILERLRLLNVDFLQGFYLHRPELS
jgi:PAS domain S-box-containing protein/diguanylate cyclase (GGDEF)-like protein